MHSQCQHVSHPGGFLVLGNGFSEKRVFFTPAARLEKYWALLLAFLPFWGPINPLTLGPDFNPAYILTSGTGLSFCLSTPLYLAILSLYFPRVNKPVFVATSFVGVMLGLGNLVLEFVIYPGWWWIGVLHIPLFVISLYCLALAFNEIAKPITG